MKSTSTISGEPLPKLPRMDDAFGGAQANVTVTANLERAEQNATEESGKIGPAGRQSLTTLLSRIRQKDRMRKSSIWLLVAALAIPLVWLAVSAIQYHGPMDARIVILCIALLAVRALYTVRLPSEIRPTTADERALLTRLEAETSIAELDTLVAALNMHNYRVRMEVSQTISRLLASLRPDHGDLLETRHIRTLCSWLSLHAHTDRELACEMLQTLERVGDVRALGITHQLADREAATPDEQAMRGAARKALATIADRVDFGGVARLREYVGHFVATSSEVVGYQTSAMYTEGLVRILPTLTREQYFGTLNGRLRSRIYLTVGIASGARRRYRWEEATIALLRTFAAVGDVDALHTVAALAHMEAASSAERAIRIEARECLTLLSQCVERKKVSDTLLRASAIPTAAPDTLLRPVADTNSVPSHELLRGAAREAGDDIADQPVDSRNPAPRRVVGTCEATHSGEAEAPSCTQHR